MEESLLGTRGPLRVHCSRCMAFRKAASVKIPRALDQGKRRFYYESDPDIAWFRRKRVCAECGREFLTAEADESLLQELLSLRKRVAKYKARDSRKMVADVRASRKWLDTTGDDVPLELAAALVRDSAWWLTHIHGPCRAPRHSKRLRASYCGWVVDFGANSFAAGRAVAKSRDYSKQLFEMAGQGRLPTASIIEREFRLIPTHCVLNVNSDFYDHYPADHKGDMIFGATSIDTNDCQRVLMEITGITELLAALARADEAA